MPLASRRPLLCSRSQQGTGGYNATYNCNAVLRPVAALFTKHSVPFSRIMVAGMHREERKGEQTHVMGPVGTSPAVGTDGRDAHYGVFSLSLFAAMAAC